MLSGRATIFLSCSEAYKPRVGRVVAAELASHRVHAVLVSDEPLLIGDDLSPDGKVERYLDVADAFVALCTPDDVLRSGRVHCRQNIIDEIQRARQKPHLRSRIMLFKDIRVTLPSNLGLTYMSIDVSEASRIGALVHEQLVTWQVLAPSVEEVSAGEQSDLGRSAGSGVWFGRDHHAALLANLGEPVTLSVVRALLHGPKTQKELALDLHLAGSTVSRRIRSLEDLGLAQRDRLRGPCRLSAPDATRRLLVASLELATMTAYERAESAEADVRELRGGMLRQVPAAGGSHSD